MELPKSESSAASRVSFQELALELMFGLPPPKLPLYTPFIQFFHFRGQFRRHRTASFA